MTSHVRALVLVHAFAGLTIAWAGTASASTPASYSVLCVVQQIPGDPQPYSVCVPKPV